MDWCSHCSLISEKKKKKLTHAPSALIANYWHLIIFSVFTLLYVHITIFRARGSVVHTRTSNGWLWIITRKAMVGSFGGSNKVYTFFLRIENTMRPTGEAK